jgi:hypothetical protein
VLGHLFSPLIVHTTPEHEALKVVRPTGANGAGAL